MEKERNKGIQNSSPSLGDTLKSLGVNDIVIYDDFKENHMIKLNDVRDLNYVNSRKKWTSCDDDEIEEVDLDQKRKGDAIMLRKVYHN